MIQKVLITGANGFIGSHFVDYYLNRECSVFGVDITEAGIINARMKSIAANLEHETLSQQYRELAPDVFIHCAGNASVGVSVENPEHDFNSNVAVLYRVLSDIKTAGINPIFLFMSSAAVYGNPPGLPVRENCPTAPISPYGFHKKICEDICLYHAKTYGLNVKIARVFSAYGAGLKKQILWDISRKIIETGRLELFGTGNESRDFIHVLDIVNAINLIIKDKRDERIFNIANGEEITIRRLAELFLRQMDHSLDVLKFNGVVKNGDPVNWRADISNLKHTGYRQSLSMEKGVSDYITWIKQYQKPGN